MSNTGKGGCFVIFRLFKSIFLIEFHSNFSISYKILTNYVYYYCILIRIVQAVGTFFSCPLCFFPYSRLSSYLLRLFLYLISFLLFPCASVWGKHSCMSSPFPIAILNGTCFFPTVQLQVHNVKSQRKNQKQLCTSKPEPLN